VCVTTAYVRVTRESLVRCRLPVAVWSGGGVDWRGTRTLLYVFSRAPKVWLVSNLIEFITKRNNINNIFFKHFYGKYILWLTCLS